MHEVRQMLKFQSSPKLSPGCDVLDMARKARMSGFNPHPSCLLGATRRVFFGQAGTYMFQSSPKLSPGCDEGRRVVVQPPTIVSILTQVVSWVRQEWIDGVYPQSWVSILTQVVSWVRRSISNASIGPYMFQSSPKLSPGCDTIGGGSLVKLDVSILTQVVSWVRPSFLLPESTL